MKTQAMEVAVALAAAWTLAGRPQTTSELPPLEVARILAAQYPEEMSVRYIPALAWSGALRLSALTGRPVGGKRHGARCSRLFRQMLNPWQGWCRPKANVRHVERHHTQPRFTVEEI
jgi:hypothetical protein